MLAFTVGFWYALPLIIVGLVFLASYFLFGTIQSASELLQVQQIEAAEKRLALTASPKFLLKLNRGYYYMIKGGIAVQKNDVAEAEEMFTEAQNHNLQTDNDKAMVWLNLASINIQKRKFQQAISYQRQLKKLTITEPMIKEQIKELDKAIKARGHRQVQRRGKYRPR